MTADSSTTPPSPARRRVALATLLAMAAAGSAQAQMGPGGGGGGPGGGRSGGGPGGSRPDKDKDAPGGRNAEPRDLVAAFARRLREGVPELAIAPAQADAWRDFLASLTEVGQHNERRLQRILFHSASSFSAAAPWRSYLAAEVDEGEGRQQALGELKRASDILDTRLDERQRAVLGQVFVTVRGEVQAPPGGDRER